MYRYLFLLATALLPLTTSAQPLPGPAPGPGLGGVVTAFLTWTNIFIYFLLGIAFLVFIINVIRYFVVESPNQEGKEKARALAVYSVFAFVIIIIFWGIINMLAVSTGIQSAAPLYSDYCTLPTCI